MQTQVYKTTVTVTFVDEDAISAFCVVECSGLKTGRFAVRIDESGQVPIATACSCKKPRCAHQQAVNRYFYILYNRMSKQPVQLKSEPVIVAPRNASGFIKKVANFVNEDLASKAVLGRQDGFNFLKVS